MTTTKEAGAAGDQATRGDLIDTLPQYFLPHHFLSGLMRAFTRINIPAVKNWQIETVVKKYQVDLSTAIEPNPLAYANFNRFFTRALRPDARPLATESGAIASPVDGRVSQAGPIREGRIFQAKGQEFSALELLGGSAERAKPFMNGQFATIYLSPRDYHRIHIPLDGTLTEMVHVPGRLFSVNPKTVSSVPRLFARNERVATLFDTPAGPMAVVMVGAIFVSGMETVWAGEVTPGPRSRVRSWNYGSANGESVSLRKGDELGRFNMGSTVVLLFPPGKTDWTTDLVQGKAVNMGQKIGRVR